MQQLEPICRSPRNAERLHSDSFATVAHRGGGFIESATVNRTYKDIAGQKFGRLTALAIAGIKWGGANWLCQCDCGKQTTVTLGYLQRGVIRSCGCYKRDEAKDRMTKHGGKGTREYRAWAHIKDRCHNPKSKGYQFYGARGITVCERWRSSFEAFRQDMGLCPVGFTIERKDNNGNYNPENCKWASWEEQHQNKRGGFYITFNGATMLASHWDKKQGLRKGTIGRRINLGWTVERAIMSPSRRPAL